MSDQSVEPIAISALQKLAQLKLELREAVKKEAFEQAAVIRDQILELERRITQKPAKRRQTKKAKTPAEKG